jgi:hypothetical protein
MKIFWSWQSDSPGNIGRHFVREALETTLTELNQELQIHESDRLELDHDRKGVAGSPDLVATILKKIDESDVFIADVTPVGKNIETDRPLLNSNVAIELGYALAKLSDARLLMVLNTHFGERESLPFDLRHKSGPIMFKLGPKADKDERKRARAELIRDLKIALKEYLKEGDNQEPSAKHEEIPISFTIAQYFEDGAVLAEREHMNGLQLRYKVGPFLYLRLIPTRAMPMLRDAQIADLVYGIQLLPLNTAAANGGCHGRNRFGGITYDFEQDGGWIITSSQIFFNRELWGIDTAVLDEANKQIPSLAFERVLDSGLRHYVQFAAGKLELESPVMVEAGISRVKGYRMAMGGGTFWGPVNKPDIQSRHELRSFEVGEIDRVLLAIFEDFFDAVGKHRPPNFRGFPPA